MLVNDHRGEITSLAGARPWTVADGTVTAAREDPRADREDEVILAIPPAVALGALASRAVTRTVRTGVAVLAVSAVLVVVLGLRGSWVPWLVPPVMATARALNDPGTPPAATLSLLVGWAVIWSVVAFAGYAALRRSRS